MKDSKYVLAEATVKSHRWEIHRADCTDLSRTKGGPGRIVATFNHTYPSPEAARARWIDADMQAQGRTLSDCKIMGCTTTATIATTRVGRYRIAMEVPTSDACPSCDDGRVVQSVVLSSTSAYSVNTRHLAQSCPSCGWDTGGGEQKPPGSEILASRRHSIDGIHHNWVFTADASGAKVALMASLNPRDGRWTYLDIVPTASSADFTDFVDGYLSEARKNGSVVSVLKRAIDNVTPMWSTELEGDPDTGEDAADVSGTPTPGQSVADYPQPMER